MKHQRKRKPYRARMWAGFCENGLMGGFDGDAWEARAGIFFSRAKAKKCFEDVRPIEVREIKRGVKP